MTGDYRYLLIDVESGQAEEIVLICLTDADALLIARGIGGGRDVEVWEDHRLVGCVPAGAHRERIVAA
jgi:hypothetical protein